VPDITYAHVYDWDNLYSAWKKAAKGKRGQAAAAGFEYHLEDNLIGLQEDLAHPRNRNNNIGFRVVASHVIQTCVAGRQCRAATASRPRR
jgi:hypothetical protein